MSSAGWQSAKLVRHDPLTASEGGAKLDEGLGLRLVFKEEDKLVIAAPHRKIHTAVYTAVQSRHVRGARGTAKDLDPVMKDGYGGRSEERRVGKECSG